MLERVDEVPWAALSDDPRAVRIPEHLRALTAEDKKSRQLAAAKLPVVLAPQGLAEPVALEAVPFLHEVALAAEVADRGPVVALLADLAAGGSHPNVLAEGLDLDSPWARRDLYEAVAARGDEYVPLLEHRDGPLRAATALLLGLLPDRATASAAALRDRLKREKAAVPRASMLVALGLCARRLGERGDAMVFRAALADKSPLVALGGACGLAYVDEALDEAIARLLDAHCQGVKAGAGFPWHHGDAAALALVVLLGACVRHGRVDPIAQLLGEGKSSAVGAAVVRAAFPKRDTMVLPAELSEMQRGVLQQVASCNTASDELFAALNARGFVTHATSLARFAGASAAGPLDRVVDGAPRWKHLRDVLDGRRPAGELTDWLACIEPAEALALCEDITGLYMSLHLPFPRFSVPDQVRTAAGFAAVGKLCVDLLREHVPAELLMHRLGELAATPAQANRRTAAALLAAYARRADAGDAELGPFEELIGKAMDPGNEPLLREVFARLALPRRAALILAKPLAFVRLGSAWYFKGCLPYLDLVPTAEAAAIAVEALVSRPDPPVDRLVEVLVAIGAPSLLAIDAALGRAELAAPIREALSAIREALLERDPPTR